MINKKNLKLRAILWFFVGFAFLLAAIASYKYPIASGACSITTFLCFLRAMLLWDDKLHQDRMKNWYD